MKLLPIFLAMLLSFSCGNTKATSEQQGTPNTMPVPQKSSFKTVKKYGFEFRIPNSWQETVSNLKATDLKGNVKAIESDYNDTKNQSQIKMVYHPGNNGQILYDYYAKNALQKGKTVQINGQKAIEITETLKYDGKGHQLSTPVTRHKIYLLSPNQNGSLEIIYDFPVANTKAQAGFKAFISQIKPASQN